MPETQSRQPIVVRQMDFHFPANIDPVVVAGDPEQSYMLIGLSLLLPYLEPYLIRTMKVAKKQVQDENLIRDIESFNGQEGQHFKQHMKLNDAIRLQGFEELGELEQQLDADYRRFTKTHSLRFNLAYAEGFEALTTAAARFSFERGEAENTHPAVAALFKWHLVEELEHRTVAFDVYDHLCGGYFYRLFAGLYAQWHMAKFISRVSKVMLEKSPEVVAACGGEAGRKLREKKAFADIRRMFLPKLLKTYSPRYTPHNIPFEDELKEMASEFTEAAIRTS
jgi:predicted metal-dependent hydrolase